LQNIESTFLLLQARKDNIYRILTKFPVISGSNIYLNNFICSSNKENGGNPKMNLHLSRLNNKNFYFKSLTALFAIIAVFSASNVSAQDSLIDEDYVSAEMLRYSLNFKSAAKHRVLDSNSDATAQRDLAASYSAISQLPCKAVAESELTGKTFSPGVYCLNSAELAGAMTLDSSEADGIFIFRVAGSLSTKGNSQVVLANRAQSGNVFFVAGESITVGEGTNLKGNLVSRRAINAQPGSIITGKAYSLEGKVTVADNTELGAGTGTLQICKALDPATIDISNRIFNFTVSGTPGTIAVPVGSCSAPIDVPVGPQTVTELATGQTTSSGTFNGGFILNRIEVISSNSNSTLGVINLATRTAAINVAEGGTAQQLTLRFVNQAAITGFVEICKFAATGPGESNPFPTGDRDVIGFFTFNVEGIYTTSQQNPTQRIYQAFVVPVGGCSGPIAVSTPPFAPGQTSFNTRISELPRAGAFLESVDTAIANRLINFVRGQRVDANGNVVANPGGGYATIQVVAGDTTNRTTINFRNRSNPSLVKVCKIAGPGVPLNTLFRFTIEGFGATDAASPQAASYSAVQRIVNIPAGNAATGGNCVFIPGFGTGTGNAEFQTFVNGTTVIITENGLTPNVTQPTQPANATLHTTRIRVSAPSTFVQPSPFAPRPNPDLQPGTGYISRTAFIARQELVEVEFTNIYFTTAVLKVCKIAGPGVAVGTPFTFNIALVQPQGAGGALQPAATTSVTIAAGPADHGGNCTFVDAAPFLNGAFNTFNQYTITEVVVEQVSVSYSSPTTTLSTCNPTNFRCRVFSPLPSPTVSLSTNLIVATNVATSPPHILRTAFDFEGDGRADISVFRNGIWYIRQSSNDQLRAVHFGFGTDKPVPVDFDGDGKTDIAVFRNGIWYYLQSSDGAFRAIQFGQAGDIPVPADYDGDGRADIAVYRAGILYRLNSSNGQFVAIQFGLANDKPVFADYDGDGKTDLAVFRGGNWYYLQSSDGAFRAVQFGISSDRPLPADYDGDGKADLAVYRSGVWYILRSRDGFTAFNFGLASDTPVPADYNGDGRTDAAVFRPGAFASGPAVWFIRLDNSVISVPFGEGTDIPIPAAFR
jgi:hypothetical protein